jgi:hypothetical protein
MWPLIDWPPPLNDMRPAEILGRLKPSSAANAGSLQGPLSHWTWPYIIVQCIIVQWNGTGNTRGSENKCGIIREQPLEIQSEGR